MRKFLLLVLALLPTLGISASAAPVALDLLGGGLSILDSLVLIAVGMVLIGLIFICIAFLKSTPKEKELEIVLGDNKPRDFFSNQVKDEENIVEDDQEEILDIPEDAEDMEDEELPEEDIEEVIEEETTEPEEPVDDIQEEEPETEPEIEDEPEIIPDEEIIEEEPEEVIPEEETIIYPKLILIDPQTNDFKILPLCGETTIGRKTTNDLVLIDDTISGLHCVILAEDDKAYIEDKGSTNGTYLNGERVMEKSEIKHGDMLTIGKQSFLINYHA